MPADPPMTQYQDSGREFSKYMTAQSIFNAPNIFIPQEESDRDYDPQIDSKASAGQQSGIPASPHAWINSALPKYSPRLDAKEVTLVNADLPLELTEQRLSSKDTPKNDQRTPAMMLQAVYQQPYAQAKKLLKEERKQRQDSRSISPVIGNITSPFLPITSAMAKSRAQNKDVPNGRQKSRDKGTV